MRVEGATGQLRGPAARRERAGSVGVGDSTHRVLMEGVRWREEVVARWHFWIFGWGCGDESRWVLRGSEGEGGGALGSSHSARVYGALTVNNSNTPHTRLLLFLAGQRIHTAGRCDADRFEMPCIKRRPGRVGGATGRPWGPTTRRERAGRIYHSNVSI